MPARTPRGGKPRGGNEGRDGGNRQDRIPSEGPIGQIKIKTAEKDAKGIVVCKMFNDRRGCNSKNCKKSHLCDVIIESGEKCGQRHRRVEHVAKIHGRPTER